VTDPSNVLTSDNIASLNAVLTKAERALVSMRSRGRNVPYSKFGTGLRHASAGKKGVKGKSCSLFFSREVKNGGLETIVTIHAVGGHTASGPASYEIHESFIPTLKKGAEVSLWRRPFSWA
jgi:hypothetical protein